MKFMSAFVCIFTTICCLSASAQESAPARSSSLRGDSDAQRQDKQLTVVAQLVGLSTAGIGTQQIHLGYFLSPTALVQLEVGQGNNNYGLISFSSSTSTRVDSFGLQFKKFVGNSFYFKTGADYQTIDRTYGYNYSYSNSYAFKGSVLGASFSIGNQWQFENFTLGCDWVGILLPLASNTTKDVVTANSTYSREESDSEQKRFFKDSSMQFVRFYLGASF